MPQSVEPRAGDTLEYAQIRAGHPLPTLSWYTVDLDAVVPMDCRRIRRGRVGMSKSRRQWMAVSMDRRRIGQRQVLSGESRPTMFPCRRDRESCRSVSSASSAHIQCIFSAFAEHFWCVPGPLRPHRLRSQGAVPLVGPNRRLARFVTAEDGNGGKIICEDLELEALMERYGAGAGADARSRPGASSVNKRQRTDTAPLPPRPPNLHIGFSPFVGVSANRLPSQQAGLRQIKSRPTTHLGRTEGRMEMLWPRRWWMVVLMYRRRSIWRRHRNCADRQCAYSAETECWSLFPEHF